MNEEKHRLRVRGGIRDLRFDELTWRPLADGGFEAVAQFDKLPQRIETWVTEDVTDEWVAAYRISIQHGAPVVAEVRVFPNEQEPTGTERGLGQWSEADESVPTNGVPSRLMRNVSPRVAHEVGHKILQQVARERGKNFAATAKALRIDPATIKLPPTPPAGRRRLPERQLAQLAARYVDARLSGSPSPVKDVAEQLSEKPEWVSGRVHTARVRGLLTRTAKGRPGGALTERAEELLKGQP